MQGVDPDHHQGAGFDPMAVDLDVLHCHADHRGARWAQAQPFVQHLGGVLEPRKVLGCQSAIEIQEDLLGQARLLLNQPRLDCYRLAVVPARMAQKDPRHAITPSHPGGWSSVPSQAPCFIGPR